MSQTDSERELLQLRILFGPLFGSDITILRNETFFRVGDALIDDSHDALTANTTAHYLERAIDTLYIPYQSDAPNFRLRVFASGECVRAITETGGDALNDFEIDFLSADGCDTRGATFNTVCRSGDVAFAVKRHHETWSDGVVRYTPRPAPIDARRDAGDVAGDVAGASGVHASRFALKLTGLLVAGAALAALAYWQAQRHVGAQKLASVAELLAGSPARNAILPGADGSIYVLSASQDGAEWDREALLKAALPEKVEVVVIGAERHRIESQLDEAGVDFVTVRLDAPAHPVLVVTHGLSSVARDAAVRELRRAAPYAEDVRVVDAALGAIEQDARDALDRIGARYRLLPRQGGATFEVATSFGDEELAALQALMRSFGHKWGMRRVDFKIALRTDWLKGKSYRDGGDGYVLLDHASWYFPQPLEGAHSR
ncbi:PrgH/EprH family type III secretion apparatus protein [Burkholderia alba]|uniref:PrgH/EprH family type III secretion apparatus protein n=1 Tax=Burkholderia alba TaxID=2683677 RepID=UPI002B05F6EF|nr:PrgH/EprH family type III secretion apparatus protein [Burkholderia alba]